MTEAIQNASDAVENIPGFDIANDAFGDVAEEYLQTKGKYLLIRRQPVFFALLY